MTSITEILQRISDPTLSNDDRVLLRCQLARQFEKVGNYQAGCGALDEMWLGFGKYPNLERVGKPTAAEVLLRVGVLTGWIGSARLIKGSQEIARNRINESIAIFESLNDEKKVAEAQ